MRFVSGVIVAGLASLASAQLGIGSGNGNFTCGAHPNGAYCAGANIIIRCTDGVGQPGNCNDNLAGYPPLGVNYSPCFQCDANSGRAACSKDGIVYPGSGSGLGDTPFPSNDTSICQPAPGNNGTYPSPTGTGVVPPTYPQPSGSGVAPPPYPYPSGTGTGGGSSPSIYPPIPSYTGAATAVQAAGVLGLGAMFAVVGLM